MWWALRNGVPRKVVIDDLIAGVSVGLRRIVVGPVNIDERGVISGEHVVRLAHHVVAPLKVMGTPQVADEVRRIYVHIVPPVRVEQRLKVVAHVGEKSIEVLRANVDGLAVQASATGAAGGRGAVFGGKRIVEKIADTLRAATVLIIKEPIAEATRDHQFRRWHPVRAEGVHRVGVYRPEVRADGGGVDTGARVGLTVGAVRRGQRRARSPRVRIVPRGVQLQRIQWAVVETIVGIMKVRGPGFVLVKFTVRCCESIVGM